jgi:hypothetical protein
MPLTDLTNTLTANITVTEQSTGNVIVNRGIGNLAFSSDYGQFWSYYPVTTGGNVILITGGLAKQIYVKNIDPAIHINVNLTALAGATTASAALYPGGVWMTWSDPALADGYTNFSITSSGVGVVEIFIGG